MRGKKRSVNPFLTQEFLEEHYTKQELTIGEIAKLLSLPEDQVAEKLVEFGIPRRYRHFSKRHCLKLSEKTKGRLVSKETGEKIRKARKGKTTSLKGRPKTEEHKRHTVEARRKNGKPWHSDETRKKISETFKNKVYEPITLCPKCKIREKHVTKSGKRGWYCKECEKPRTEEDLRKERERNKTPEVKLKNNLYRRIQYATNLNFRIQSKLSSALNTSLKTQRVVKSKRIPELLGCTIEELKIHIEKQFEPGMTWDNYSFYGWHIDHIVPCASFDLSKVEEQQKCFHYKNLQPKWCEDNWSKNSTYEGITYRKNSV